MENEWLSFDTYLEQLHRDFGWELFLYDFEGLLSQAGPVARELANAWHNNPYCVAMKNDGTVHRRCVRYRSAFLRRVRRAKEPFTHTCFCAVAERVVPVRRFGRTVAAIAVGGLQGVCRPAYEGVLARRIHTEPGTFAVMRQDNLTAVREQTLKQIDAYLGVAAGFIGSLAEAGNTTVTQNSDRYIRQAEEFIELHFAEPITTADVANACHVSVSYLQHLFLAKEGCGIYNKIEEHRMGLAKRLLKDTDGSVRHIALACGYTDPDYFSAAFKKRCGTSPLSYRQKAK